MARRKALLAVSLTLAVAVVWWASSSAPDDSEPADPWLWLRSPVVEFLHQEEFVRSDRVEALLPTLKEGGRVWSGADGIRIWDGLIQVRREPVYDGPFEHLGIRVTIEQEIKAEVRAVRLHWGGAGETGFADAERVGPSDAPGFNLWHARMLVPNRAAYWQVIYLHRDGNWHGVIGGGVTRDQL